MVVAEEEVASGAADRGVEMVDPAREAEARETEMEAAAVAEEAGEAEVAWEAVRAACCRAQPRPLRRIHLSWSGVPVS